MAIDVTDDLFVEYLCWLITRDERFCSLYADSVLPQGFSTPEIAFLVEAAKKFYKDFGKTLPEEALVMLLDELPESSSIDQEVVLGYYRDAPEPSEVMNGFISQHAKSWFQRRMLLAQIDRATDLLEDAKVDDAVKVLGRALTDASSLGDDDYGVGIFSDMERLIGEWEMDLSIESLTAIKTGCKTIDRVMRGGLRGGELGVVMAGPNSGKSQWLCHVAREASQAGKNVIFYTLEMDSKRVAQRIWAGIIDMDAEDMSMAENFSTVRRLIEKWEVTARGQVHENGDLVLNADGSPVAVPWGEIIVKRYPAKAASVTTLAGHIAMLETYHNFKPDLIVVDYADILAPARKYEVRRDELGAVYEDLRGLGQLLDVPIWTASQANREGFTKGNLKMEHIADSWDKAKIADYIWGICIDKDGPPNVAQMAAIKIRNNAMPAMIPFATDFGRAIFYDQGMAA